MMTKQLRLFLWVIMMFILPDHQCYGQLPFQIDLLNEVNNYRRSIGLPLMCLSRYFIPISVIYIPRKIMINERV